MDSIHLRLRRRPIGKTLDPRPVTRALATRLASPACQRSAEARDAIRKLESANEDRLI